jgi:hypothetical protein
MLKWKKNHIEAPDIILVRRGTVENDLDGTPLLINHKGEGYRVNDTAISFWNMCNGITFQDLMLEVLRISNDDKWNIRRALLEMLNQFNQVSVIEMKKVRRNTFIAR